MELLHIEEDFFLKFSGLQWNEKKSIIENEVSEFQEPDHASEFIYVCSTKSTRCLFSFTWTLCVSLKP